MFFENKWKVFLLVLCSIIFVNCRHVESQTEGNLPSPRPSMLNMMAKFIEANKTIDTIISQSPEHARHWFNSTRKPHIDVTSVCPQEEEYIETIEVKQKIPYVEQVEVWCWSSTFKCMEEEVHYREEIKLENVTRMRMVDACCDGFEINPNTEKCEPVCSQFCENDGFCVAPETCHCEFGYEGNYCQIDALPSGILVGPNVCQVEEEYLEDYTFTENQIIQWEEKHWCWKIPPRCSQMKSAEKPVKKVKHIPKTRIVSECCPGFKRNGAGNRCLPVSDVENLQQVQVQ